MKLSILIEQGVHSDIAVKIKDRDRLHHRGGWPVSCISDGEKCEAGGEHDRQVKRLKSKHRHLRNKEEAWEEH